VYLYMPDDIDTPVLFHDPTSEPSRAVHWFAVQASIPIQLRYTWLTRNEHFGDELLAVNPRHQIPAMRQGDFCLSEATAIIGYLAEVSGNASEWFGSVAQERARINMLLSWYHTNLRLRGTLEYFLPVLLAPSYLGHPAPPQHAVDRLRGNVRTVLEQIEQFLGASPFLGGERIVAPDVVFASEVFALDCDPNRDLYVSNLPRLSTWLNRLRGLAGYQESHRAWNVVVPLISRRLREGVAQNSTPAWVADACKQVLS
jgi:glutathione S-transferase